MKKSHMRKFNELAKDPGQLNYNRKGGCMTQFQNTDPGDEQPEDKTLKGEHWTGSYVIVLAHNDPQARAMIRARLDKHAPIDEKVDLNWPRMRPKFY